MSITSGINKFGFFNTGFNPLSLKPIFFLTDLNTPVNGYWVDKSGNNKLIQAATTTVLNDSLIMPANDNDIISGVTLASCYSIFYINNSTPKKVKLSNILQSYGTNFYFNEWSKQRMCLFSTSLNTDNHNLMVKYITYIDWLFPTGVINFSQTINFTKIFGKLEK